MENNTEQSAIIHNMTPTQKYQAAMGLLHAALRLKEASLKAWYPNLTEGQRKLALRDYILYART